MSPANKTAATDPVAVLVHQRAIAERNKAETALGAILTMVQGGAYDNEAALFRLAEVRNAAQAAGRCVDVEPSAHVVYCAEWAGRCLAEAKAAVARF